MSRESSLTSSSITSDSPCESPNNQLIFFSGDKEDLTDLTLYGSPAPRLTRRGTVIKRANTLPVRSSRSNLSSTSSTEEESYIPDHAQNEPHLSPSTRDRLKRGLEEMYRLSLDSISEDRRSSMSTVGGSSSTRHSFSIEYSSSSCTADQARRSSTRDAIDREEKTIRSPNSSYLSWIESVNSGCVANVESEHQVESLEIQDLDSRVGEWNNFWLNYNTARGQYLASSCVLSTNLNNGNVTDQADDEASDAKSNCSTQGDVSEKQSEEMVTLTLDEFDEAVRCTQRLTDILQNAAKRSEQNSSAHDSFYSPPIMCSRKSSTKDGATSPIKNRERSVSCGVDPKLLVQQKQMLKSTQPQSSSTSCINALLTSGVADILKRVMLKRRDVITSEEVNTRSSFSEWE